MRDWLIAIGLFLGTALLGAASFLYPSDLLTRSFLTLLSIAAVYLVFEVLLVHALVRRIRDDKARYTLTKVLYILSLIILGVAGIKIWVENTQSLTVFLGLIGAGVAIALQDLFRNFTGSIILITTGIYRVGDRISTGTLTGDVIDIGLMNTTVMEIGGWIKGDQPTGRITAIPNGVVLNQVIHNYTRDNSYIWDEIMIPLTYVSDWKKARDLILALVVRETAATTAQAKAEIERMGEKYYLTRKVIEPGIYILPTDNWIELEIRYVTDVRERRATKTHLSEMILEAIAREPSLTIASETLTVTPGSSQST
jgi:small-conductance mechanosensitive channel